MPVNTKHKEYNDSKIKWQRVRDFASGEDSVKQAGELYLPKLNGQNDDSYKAYKDRARYINFTGRTLETTIGQLFRKLPVVQGLDETLMENVDLTGRSFYYFSRTVAREMFLTNRVGVLVDYSEEQGRPYLTLYRAEEIINWKSKVINGETKLDFVVLQGKREKENSDPFESKLEDIWRVLKLDESGLYVVEDYVRSGDLGEDFIKVNEFIPVINNSRFDFIPFYFVTTGGNTSEIYNPPLLDFVNVNAGHYKNSADYENMLHWTGAKTIITKGYGNSPFPVGSAVDLPVDGDAFFLQSSSDSGLMEEMRRKEEQMSVMGNSIITGKGRYVASAETARTTSASEYATLADMAHSLSDSMTYIMQLFGEWSGSSEKVSIEYNTDYEAATIDPTTFTTFMAAVQGEMLSWDTFFYIMQGYELYPDGWTIDDEIKAIEARKVVEEIPKDEEAIKLEEDAENI